VAATTGYQTRSFAEAGSRLGLEMVLATDRCHLLDDPWGDRAVPIRFEHPEESGRGLAGLRVDAIVAVGDRPAWIAAIAAAHLGLPFHPAAAVKAAGDKHLARKRFTAAGLFAPDHYRLPLDSDSRSAEFYPCVLKPLCLSGSRGVIRANNDWEFHEAFVRIRAILEGPEIQRLGDPRNRLIQVERFVEGPEFALEGLVTRGKLRTLAIFDKPDPLNGPYFEETIYVTPSCEPAEAQVELAKAAQRAVTALGLWHGPVHAEMRLTSHGVFVLEAAARPIGGLCSRAVKFSHEKTLEELILLHALGDEQPTGAALPAGVMMVPIPKGGIFESVVGLEEARAVSGIEDIAITAKVGQPLAPLPEGSSYLGFIFARGNCARKSIAEAHAKLSFVISTALPITPNRR
jgi:biotin carboxylase